MKGKRRPGLRVVPVIDTEVLFAFSPTDSKHSHAVRLLDSRNNLMATDTVLLEFQLVLRGRGKSSRETREAMLALDKILLDHGVKQVKTINASLLALQSEIEFKSELSYFDSLIAASALSVDGIITSDDRAFDRVSGLKRETLAE